MAETMEQYMSKTRADYGSGVARFKIEDKYNFELKGKFLKKLRDNTFSGSDHEDENKHIEKVLEIVDLSHIPNITIDQVMLRAFPMSLTRAASRWLRNKPSGSITTWADLKTKILSKYYPPARTQKLEYKGNNVVGALIIIPIFVGTFSILTYFAVLEDMDAYRDKGMDDVILGEPFFREVRINVKWFEGMITFHNGNEEVTYLIVRSHPRFKHHTNEEMQQDPTITEGK
ncbi:homeodomain-like protein [Tanacetum coccineum]